MFEALNVQFSCLFLSFLTGLFWKAITYKYTYIVTSWRQSNTPILLITTMSLWRHAGYGWPVASGMMSIASMLPQSRCGDEDNGQIGLSSWCHYICIMLFALCWALCVLWTNFCFSLYTHVYIYTHVCIYIYIYICMLKWPSCIKILKMKWNEKSPEKNNFIFSFGYSQK